MLPVVLRGASGANSKIINGTYVQTGDIVNGKAVYANMKDEEVCLVLDNSKHWMVTTDPDTKKGIGSSGIATTEFGVASPVAANIWRVATQSGWSEQSGLVASFLVSASFSSLFSSKPQLLFPSRTRTNTYHRRSHLSMLKYWRGQFTVYQQLGLTLMRLGCPWKTFT